MKTLKEMTQLVDNKTARLLTTAEARNLEGKKIQTIYFGYKGQDQTDEFVVGRVMSELEYYRQLEEPCFPDARGYRNRAEYWESFMTKEQLDDHKRKQVLLREDGSNTFIYTYNGVFVCSDDDRYVFFVEVEQ